MNTIENFSEFQTIIKKSKFIGYIYQVNSIDDFEKKLNIIKEKHPSSTHICYAYIIDQLSRSNDDGEPSGTAGAPILNVLKKNDLNYTCVFIVRYYGRIKLGAGGLIRAYSSVTTELVKQSKFVLVVEKATLKIRFSYDYEKFIDNLIRKYNVEILENIFLEDICLTIRFDDSYFDEIKKELNNIEVAFV